MTLHANKCQWNHVDGQISQKLFQTELMVDHQIILKDLAGIVLYQITNNVSHQESLLNFKIILNANHQIVPIVMTYKKENVLMLMENQHNKQHHMLELVMKIGIVLNQLISNAFLRKHQVGLLLTLIKLMKVNLDKTILLKEITLVMD